MKNKQLIESVVRYMESLDGAVIEENINLNESKKINEAHLEKDRKKIIADNVKKAIPKLPFKSKITLSIRHYSELLVKIKSTELLNELMEVYQDGNTGYTGGVNHKPQLRKSVERALDNKSEPVRLTGYNPQNLFKGGGKAKNLYKYFEILDGAIKSTGWHDNTEVQTDYFDTDFYINIEVYQG